MTSFPSIIKHSTSLTCLLHSYQHSTFLTLSLSFLFLSFYSPIIIILHSKNRNIHLKHFKISKSLISLRKFWLRYHYNWKYIQSIKTNVSHFDKHRK
jgi:hypothetical protein